MKSPNGGITSPPGSALYVGGDFTRVAGNSLPANHIARWDGTQWSTLGDGVGGSSRSFVQALTVFDDGGGRALYAGGDFNMAGGAPANKIARWDGTGWTPLDSGIAGPATAYHVDGLTVFDEGAGPALYVAGSFFSAGGVTVGNIAKWNGASWSDLNWG